MLETFSTAGLESLSGTAEFDLTLPSPSESSQAAMPTGTRCSNVSFVLTGQDEVAMLLPSRSPFPLELLCSLFRSVSRLGLSVYQLPKP